VELWSAGVTPRCRKRPAKTRFSRGIFSASPTLRRFPPDFGGLRAIDADRRERAKSSAIENADQRRMRLVRNKRQRELYGATHRRLRRQFARRIERGEMPICPRCGLSIGPDELWDLGHDDFNPSIERPEHRTCNRAAPNQLKTSRVW
jgi:hypothetical protein